MPRSRHINSRSSKITARLLRGLPIALALALLLAHVAGFRLVVVQGGSMAPALRHGDLLLVRPYQGERMAVGDVVLWRAGNAPVAHRISEVDAEGRRATYETKGDANRESDRSPRFASQASGRVWLAVPKLGLLPAALRTPWGFALGILFPGIALLASYVRSLLATQRLPRSVGAVRGGTTLSPEHGFCYSYAKYSATGREGEKYGRPISSREASHDCEAASDRDRKFSPEPGSESVLGSRR